MATGTVTAASATCDHIGEDPPAPPSMSKPTMAEHVPVTAALSRTAVFAMYAAR